MTVDSPPPCPKPPTVSWRVCRVGCWDRGITGIVGKGQGKSSSSCQSIVEPAPSPRTSRETEITYEQMQTDRGSCLSIFSRISSRNNYGFWLPPFIISEASWCSLLSHISNIYCSITCPQITVRYVYCVPTFLDNISADAIRTFLM